jgi:hypothetical protein
VKGNRRKVAVIVGLIVLLVSAFSALFVVFLGGLNASKTDSIAPHYLQYKGSESKIYMLSSSSVLSLTNQTYTLEDGQQIKATTLYTITLTLRNDYSNENPPPSIGTPTAPIDGTAYILLKATLLNNDVTIPTTNLSQSDFRVSSSDETALVLANGQTNTLQLIFATNKTNISDFTIHLAGLSDSIPR